LYAAELIHQNLFITVNTKSSHAHDTPGVPSRDILVPCRLSVREQENSSSSSCAASRPTMTAFAATNNGIDLSTIATMFAGRRRRLFHDTDIRTAQSNLFNARAGSGDRVRQSGDRDGDRDRLSSELIVDRPDGEKSGGVHDRPAD
jgi:hypothetical protein